MGSIGSPRCVVLEIIVGDFYSILCCGCCGNHSGFFQCIMLWMLWGNHQGSSQHTALWMLNGKCWVPPHGKVYHTSVRFGSDVSVKAMVKKI